MAARLKGRLITFEGAEGSGKTTQIRLLRRFLERQQREVLFLREPGGVAISEKIRRLLLNVRHQDMVPECEMLLYMAARAQLVREKVLPALRKGIVVLCDRFLDSTLVYQGYGHGMDRAFIHRVGDFATQGLRPHLTIIFDVPAELGLARLGRTKDRIEQRSLAYHRRVRRGYLAIAKEEPDRVKVIKGNQAKEVVQREVRRWVEALWT